MVAPLQAGDFLHQAEFGIGFGLEGDEEAVAELVVFGGVFAGEQEDGGAEAVFESVEAGGSFALGCFRPNGMLGVFPVGAPAIAC